MTRIEVVASPLLSAVRAEQAHALLLDAFEEEFSDDDWAHTIGGTHVLALDGEALVAHASVVPRTLDVSGRVFATGYVEGVATRRDRRRQGLGGLAMAATNGVIRSGFELGALSTGLHAFYERLGWLRWQGPTYVRRAGETVRSADEDDGIMVLCLGASGGLDRRLPITCTERPGDDW